MDQQNKQDEMKIKATALGAKPGATSEGKKPIGDKQSYSGRADASDGGWREDGSTVEDVIASVEDDYPPTAIEWAKAVRWTGPEKVKTREVDTRKKSTWRASKDDLSGYIKRAKKGGVKPILLVETPDNDKYEIIDGHHRFLAAESIGQPVLAYCCKVYHDEGPWDTMHNAQHSGSSKDSVPPPTP